MGQMTISVHCEVEAENEEEAREKADEASTRGLCHYCSTGDTGEWFAQELDGVPKITEVDEL